MLGRKTALTATILGLTLTAVPAQAVVLHPNESPDAGDVPASSVVGRWGDNASAVAVSPTHVVTTRHQDSGSGLGRSVRIGGTTYTAAEVFLPSGSASDADIKVARIEKDGRAASLDNYVSPFTGGISTATGNATAVTIGGFGDGRGAEINETSRQGYQWDGQQGTLRFGRNLVTGTELDGDFDGFTNDQLLSAFDSPTTGLAGEATIAEGDSGGAWLVKDNDDFKLLGLTQSVQNSGEAIYQPSETLFAVDVRPHADFIASAVPEPSSALLLGGAGLVFAATGRRRSVARR